MFKEPKYIKETQDVFDRRVYVITPKVDLLSEIKKLDPSIESNELDGFAEPIVIMTEEVPFEEELEGWHRSIRNTVVKDYILEKINEFPISNLNFKEEYLENEIEVNNFFNKWWNISSPCDYYEIINGSWK